MPEKVVMVSDRGTEEKNVRERKEVTRLKNTVNTIRKYSKPVLLIALGVLFLQYLLNRFAEPVSAVLSHVHIPILGVPQIRKLGPSIMSVARGLFWLSLLVWYCTHAVKIVQQFEKAAITMFGKLKRIRKGGIGLVLYPFEGITFEGVFQRRIDIVEQPVYTRDSILSRANAIFWIRIKNLGAALFNVDDWEESVHNLLETAIRNAAAEVTEVLKLNESRSTIAGSVEKAFNEATGNPPPEKDKTQKHELGFFKKIGRALTFYSQEEMGAEGWWGIDLIRTEIQEFKIPADIEEQLRKVKVAEQRVKEAESLRDIRKKDAEATKYTLVQEGEGVAMAIKLRKEALSGEEGERVVAMHVATEMAKNTKTIALAPGNILNNLAGLFRQFAGGKTRQLEDTDR